MLLLPSRLYGKFNIFRIPKNTPPSGFYFQILYFFAPQSLLVNFLAQVVTLCSLPFSVVSAPLHQRRYVVCAQPELVAKTRPWHAGVLAESPQNDAVEDA